MQENIEILSQFIKRFLIYNANVI